MMFVTLWGCTVGRYRRFAEPRLRAAIRSRMPTKCGRPGMAQELFWSTLDHLRTLSPGFGRRRYPGKLAKMKRTIHLMDSTVIELVANCMDWAAHRRRKAAAKCHVRLNFQTLLPAFVIVDVAREHDNVRAREAAAGLKKGGILIFDRGYVDLKHLSDLTQRGVFWVTRMKDMMKSDLVGDLPIKKKEVALSDEWIALNDSQSARRIEAWVKVDGEERLMVFLTNNLDWSPDTVAELYRRRWEIELFFKQMKQTLKMCDLMSYNANGIRWQVWIALLVQLLLRHMAWLSQWRHSFVRFYALVRSILWERRNLLKILEHHGTAQGSYRNLACPEQACFPGFI